MQANAENILMFALSAGGGESLLIVALILILIGKKQWPAIARGFGEGVRALDDETIKAGKAVGGIYGKPAAEALTPDNQSAELYDPAALSPKHKHNLPLKRDKARRLLRLLRCNWRCFSKLISFRKN